MAKKRRKNNAGKINIYLVLIILVFAGMMIYIVANRNTNILKITTEQIAQIPQKIPFMPSPTQVLPAVPNSHFLSSDYQVFQTWNNCGPASLSMALYYFGIHKTQAELGYDIRPYQNLAGDNDDKSSSLDELAMEAEKFGLSAYVRPNGNMNIVKQFIDKDCQ